MGSRVDEVMWDRLFVLAPGSSRPLQAQIRELLVSAIAEGYFPPGAAVPSSRELSERLGVARNTVVLVYQQLVDEGLLESRERSGCFVRHDVGVGWARPDSKVADKPPEPVWSDRFSVRPSLQRNIVKPQNWLDYPYPFLYGQFDPTSFPIADWRECCRQAMSVLEIRGWAPDLIDGDDPLLIEQLRTQLLPRRGIWASASEIMITVGAQQALYLLAELLTDESSTIGIEEPGYPDARNIFALKRRRLIFLPVDAGGLIMGESLGACDLVYSTPSHQCPTTATMPIDRRQELLDRAEEHEFLIIEDDYESETSFSSSPTPALKALSGSQRVIYIGSLSKTLAPGLRIGYVVGPPELIREARALRRLMVRHAPANNQRAAALFLSLGHHHALIRRLIQVLRERSAAVRSALEQHMPEASYAGGAGGSSYWIEGPPTLDACKLTERAKEQGVLIEPGETFFGSGPPPRNCFRLGFSSIPIERIEPGIAKLGTLMRELTAAPLDINGDAA
jgi:GntR family transcriptional regulator / MocR family aminotransferase